MALFTIILMVLVALTVIPALGASHVDTNPISEEEVKKIEKLLPNCYVIWTTNAD